ncbi:helix-turn-helix domain-containing protein [Halocynthiibacter sp. C4]|nr:helix-turn-helix domain-containing protein [Halocynthiibacter sp. C4]MDE0590438.1 helix-turn-helix domain-containing protein [Halocynthiibacter sp. C4]
MARQKVLGSPTRKIVLMFMADCASDDGSGIWTSKSHMAADLEMSKRTVQNAITQMIEMGIISETGIRKCKNGFTKEYRINLAALSALKSTRAGDSPVQEIHPTGAGDSPQGVQEMHPNHPLTIHEPHKEETKVSKKAAATRATSIPEDAVITEKHFELVEKHGHSRQEIEAQFQKFKDNALANGRTYKNWDAAWRNWFASPYFSTLTGGGRNEFARKSTTQNARSVSRSDPALERIARLAGLSEAQGHGGA